MVSSPMPLWNTLMHTGHRAARPPGLRGHHRPGCPSVPDGGASDPQPAPSCSQDRAFPEPEPLRAPEPLQACCTPEIPSHSPPTHLHVSERLHQGNHLQLVQRGQVQDLFDFGGTAGTQVTQRQSHSSLHTRSRPCPCSPSLSGPGGRSPSPGGSAHTRKARRRPCSRPWGDGALCQPQAAVRFLPAVLTRALRPSPFTISGAPQGIPVLELGPQGVHAPACSPAARDPRMVSLCYKKVEKHPKSSIR